MGERRCDRREPTTRPAEPPRSARLVEDSRRNTVGVSRVSGEAPDRFRLAAALLQRDIRACVRLAIRIGEGGGGGEEAAARMIQGSI